MAKRKVAHQADHYTYTVRSSEEDGIFIGRVAEFPSLAAHGHTLEAALAEIKFVVSEVLKDLAESGEEIPEPGISVNYVDAI